MKKNTVLTPTYMNDFKCVGSSCADTCCSGWTVTIDERTYKKYKRVQDFELTPIINKNISRVRSNQTQANYAKIKTRSVTAPCPFLNEEQLCKVQLKLGEEYLSNTCSLYPRTINQVGDYYERSGAISCPEVARLALLNPDGLTFDEVLESSDNITPLKLTRTLKSETNKSQDPIHRYFWEMRFFIIELLQNRKLSLSHRMMVLGLFISKVQTLQDEGNVEGIPDLISSYSGIYTDPSFIDSLKSFQHNDAIQMQLLKDIMDERFAGGIQNTRYVECFTEFLLGLNYHEDMTVPQIAEYYHELHQSYYVPFLEKYDYVLENYLVNYVFSILFPMSSKSVFDNYIMMVMHFSLIKMHLIGMMGFHKDKFSIDHVLKLIQSYSKVVEHNKLYLYDILKLLRENRMDNLAYMFIVLK